MQSITTVVHVADFLSALDYIDELLPGIEYNLDYGTWPPGIIAYADNAEIKKYRGNLEIWFTTSYGFYTGEVIRITWEN